MKNQKSEELLSTIHSELARLVIGDAIHHRNLTVFPLVGKKARGPVCTLLDKAIRNGEAVVRELDNDGSVPELRLLNNGVNPLLVTEGEILIGAKQNRVVDVTVIVAAHQEVVLPVSCVEQGRWKYETAEFRTADFAPAALRADRTANRALQRDHSSHAPDVQGEVWQGVSGYLQDLDAHSPTDSMTDAYELANDRIDDYRAGLRLPAGTRGVIVCREGQAVGMDLFDSPSAMKSVWKRLSGGYILDAVRHCSSTRKSGKKAATSFYKHLSKTLQTSQAEIGCGSRIDSPAKGVATAGVWFSGGIRHLSAFADAG